MSNGNKPEDQPDFSFLGGGGEEADSEPQSPAFDFDVADKPAEELDDAAFSEMASTDSPTFDGVEAVDPSDMFSQMKEPVDEDPEESAEFSHQQTELPSEHKATEELPETAAADEIDVTEESPTDADTSETELQSRVEAVTEASSTEQLKTEVGEIASKPLSLPTSTKKSAADTEPDTSPEATPERPAEKDASATTDGHHVSQKTFSIVAGYAAALTILFLLLLLTGRISLSGQHPLESLPDIEPLKTGEFKDYKREVDGKQVDVTLPPLHDLKLGESRRFGDVVLTPIRVTREVVSAKNPNRPRAEPEAKSSGPVLKLWFELRNVSDDSSFAPWDLALMCHRYPEFSNDPDTRANSWLRTEGNSTETRVLNFLHNPESEYQLIGQNSGKVLSPGESVESFVACSEDIQHVPTDSVHSFRWRIQIRKGVNRTSGNGVTTLVDVTFKSDEVSGDAKA